MELVDVEYTKKMIKDVCRLCLKSSEQDKLVWIFDSRMIHRMEDIIYHTSGVKILEDESISQNLCIKCLETTVAMYKFRTTSMKNNRILMKRYESLTKKSTNDSRNTSPEPHNPDKNLKSSTNASDIPPMHKSIQEIKKEFSNLVLKNVPHDRNYGCRVVLERNEESERRLKQLKHTALDVQNKSNSASTKNSNKRKKVSCEQPHDTQESPKFSQQMSLHSKPSSSTPAPKRKKLSQNITLISLCSKKKKQKSPSVSSSAVSPTGRTPTFVPQKNPFVDQIGSSKFLDISEVLFSKSQALTIGPSKRQDAKISNKELEACDEEMNNIDVGCVEQVANGMDKLKEASSSCDEPQHTLHSKDERLQGNGLLNMGLRENASECERKQKNCSESKESRDIDSQNGGLREKSLNKSRQSVAVKNNKLEVNYAKNASKNEVLTIDDTDEVLLCNDEEFKRSKQQNSLKIIKTYPPKIQQKQNTSELKELTLELNNTEKVPEKASAATKSIQENSPTFNTNTLLTKENLESVVCEFCKTQFSSILRKDEHIERDCTIAKNMSLSMEKVDKSNEIRDLYPNLFGVEEAKKSDSLNNPMENEINIEESILEDELIVITLSPKDKSIVEDKIGDKSELQKCFPKINVTDNQIMRGQKKTNLEVLENLLQGLSESLGEEENTEPAAPNDELNEPKLPLLNSSDIRLITRSTNLIFPNLRPHLVKYQIPVEVKNSLSDDHIMSEYIYKDSTAKPVINSAPNLGLIEINKNLTNQSSETQPFSQVTQNLNQEEVQNKISKPASDTTNKETLDILSIDLDEVMDDDQNHEVEVLDKTESPVVYEILDDNPEIDPIPPVSKSMNQIKLKPIGSMHNNRVSPQKTRQLQVPSLSQNQKNLGSRIPTVYLIPNNAALFDRNSALKNQYKKPVVSVNLTKKPPNTVNINQTINGQIRTPGVNIPVVVSTLNNSTTNKNLSPTDRPKVYSTLFLPKNSYKPTKTTQTLFRKSTSISTTSVNTLSANQETTVLPPSTSNQTEPTKNAAQYPLIRIRNLNELK